MGAPGQHECGREQEEQHSLSSRASSSGISLKALWKLTMRLTSWGQNRGDAQPCRI